MKKSEIIDRMKAYEKDAEKNIIAGYPRKEQEKIAKTSHAILSAICEQDEVTVKQAKYALKMAGEILEVTGEYEIISKN